MSYISIIDNINNKSETVNSIKTNDILMDNMDNMDSESRGIAEKFLKEYREYSKKTDKLLNNFSIENPIIHNIYNIEPSTPGVITICSFFLSIGFITYTVRKNNIPDNIPKKVLISSSSSDSISSAENIEVINNNSSENKQTSFFSYFS